MRLAVITEPDEVARTGVADLQEELDMRPHFESPRVLWDAATRRTIVEVIYQGHDASRIEGNLAEEVWEVTAAVIGDFDTMRVEIIDTQPTIEGPDSISSNV